MNAWSPLPWSRGLPCVTENDNCADPAKRLSGLGSEVPYYDLDDPWCDVTRRALSYAYAKFKRTQFRLVVGDGERVSPKAHERIKAAQAGLHVVGRPCPGHPTPEPRTPITHWCEVHSKTLSCEMDRWLERRRDDGSIH